jgi:hypothetical protein
MEPNANEKGAAAEIRTQFEELGDRATAGADVLREYLPGNVAAQKILTVVNQPLADEYKRLVEINSKNYVKVSDPFLEQVAELIAKYDGVNEIATHHGKDSLDDETVAWLTNEQLDHRQADLSRLMKTFGASGDTVRLRKVLDADPSQPLVPQLGFSPDEF